MRCKAWVRSGMGYVAGSCVQVSGVGLRAGFRCVNADVVQLWRGRWAGLEDVRFIRSDYAGDGGNRGLGGGVDSG